MFSAVAFEHPASIDSDDGSIMLSIPMASSAAGPTAVKDGGLGPYQSIKFDIQAIGSPARGRGLLAFGFHVAGNPEQLGAVIAMLAIN